MRLITTKNTFKRGLIAVTAAIVITITTTLSASKEMDALLNILVARNVISAEDVTVIKEEVALAVAAEESQSVPVENLVSNTSVPQPMPDPRLKIASSTKVINPYGDFRLRYQFEDSTKPGKPSTNRSRWRYRLRAGMKYNFAEYWSAGVRMETSSANDSTNSNFGGYFDKQGDQLYAGLFYVNYAGEEINFTAGKHKQPFSLPSAFWDSDINPEGFSEVWETGGIVFRAGQYVIDEEDERKSGTEDDFLFVGQVEFKVGDVKLSPMFLTTTPHDSTNDENKAGFKGENANTYFENFQVVALPFSYSFKSDNGVSQKISGIFGANLQGGDALNDPSSPFWGGSMQSGDKNIFASIGYKYGKAKKAGTWEAGIEYRYVEAASYTPNLLDSDFGKDELNMQGFVLKGKWAHTDFLSSGVSLIFSEQIDENFSSSAAGLEDATILQLDLMVKF